MVSQSDFSLSKAMFATSNFTANAAKCRNNDEVAQVAATWFGDVIPSVAGAYVIAKIGDDDPSGRVTVKCRTAGKGAALKTKIATIDPGSEISVLQRARAGAPRALICMFCPAHVLTDPRDIINGTGDRDAFNDSHQFTRRGRI